MLKNKWMSPRQETALKGRVLVYHRAFERLVVWGHQQWNGKLLQQQLLPVTGRFSPPWLGHLCTGLCSFSFLLPPPPLLIPIRLKCYTWVMLPFMWAVIRPLQTASLCWHKKKNQKPKEKETPTRLLLLELSSSAELTLCFHGHSSL